MSVDVEFFENPQIRNGIRMNTIITQSKSIGILINDYNPKYFEVEDNKNTISKNTLENNSRLGV